MTNQEINSTRHFHEATKYRPAHTQDVVISMGIPPNLKSAIGEQDPANEPYLFKTYTGLEDLELPREFRSPSMPLFEALAAPGGASTNQKMPDRAALSHIALFSNGIPRNDSQGKSTGFKITRRSFQYRAASCTGAYYQLELYFVCGELSDLDAGIYHYAADTHTFRQLRSGDYRAAIVEATGNEPATATAPVLLLATCTFWRNAWRYLERAYRHAFWDFGTALSHILAVAAAERLSTKVVLGFNDDQVNRVLDVDGQREATVCIVPLGVGEQPGPAPEITPTGHKVAPISSSEIDFPLIWDTHASASLNSAEVAAWRRQRIDMAMREASTNGLHPLRPLPDSALPHMSVDEAILKRRSTRHYDIDTPLSFDLLSTLLTWSMHPIAFDCLDLNASSLTDPYLIINNVADLEQGSYVLHKGQASLELIKAGNFRQAAKDLAVGQGYPGEAHVNIYYLADLEAILEKYGNRGYRIAQLEGAIRAGKLQMAAHALNLGTVGTTSLDDKVDDFFAPASNNKNYMFAVVFGNRRKKQK